MNNFVFYSPTEFVFGKNTEVQVGALARKYGAQKVMIVYGGGSVVRSGLLDRVKQYLQEAGVAYCEMGGVQPNPIDGKVYEGIQLCRRERQMCIRDSRKRGFGQYGNYQDRDTPKTGSLCPRAFASRIFHHES